MQLEWELARVRREYRSSGFRTTAHKIMLKEKCVWILSEIDALNAGATAGGLSTCARTGERAAPSAPLA
jgi:hypothetical protein